MKEKKDIITKADVGEENPGLRFAPYNTYNYGGVIVTDTAGEFNTRSKAYSRLIHGRIEDDIRESLRNHVGKKFSSEILDPIKLDLLDLLWYTPSSDFYRHMRFPVTLEVDGTEWKIEQDGRIDCFLKNNIDYLEIEINVTKQDRIDDDNNS
jgi:hypothetical protein